MARLPDYKARDLIDVHGLTPRDAHALFDRADHFFETRRAGAPIERSLAGRTVALLFFEPSTRTLFSFELAARRLGALTVAFSPEGSSVKKGETLVDTALTIEAMGVDAAVVRHRAAGAPERLAEALSCPILNAGDGARAHPTQALLDAAVLRRAFGRVEGLTILICGDVRHSRVARSNLALLTLLGAEVRLCAPPTLLPGGAADMGVAVFHHLDAALDGVDAVMALRLQKERMTGGFLPTEREFRKLYGLDHARLARCAPRAKVMHPGPMNRGVEIDGALADDPERSLVLEQVEMGPAVRMAALEALMEAGA